MAQVRCRIPMLELGTGRKFSVVGTADTGPHAQAEAEKKLVLTCGTLNGNATISTVATLNAAPNAGTQYSDAVLVLVKGDVKRPVPLQNIATSYRLAGSEGLINTADADIIAFAAAWYDGSGAAGYSPAGGRFVK